MFAAYSSNTERAARAYLARKAAEAAANNQLLTLKCEPAAIPIEPDPDPEPEVEQDEQPQPEVVYEGHRANRPSIRRIIEEVCEGTPYTYADIIGHSRKRELAQLRHDAICAVAERREDLSQPQIGKAFGGRDHTTVLNSLRRRGLVGRTRYYARATAHVDINEVMRLHAEGLYYTQIAAKFGVSDWTISKMVRAHKQAA